MIIDILNVLMLGTIVITAIDVLFRRIPKIEDKIDKLIREVQTSTIISVPEENMKMTDEELIDALNETTEVLIPKFIHK
jgi:sugar-specific transcriptional regulator TrmB